MSDEKPTNYTQWHWKYRKLFGCSNQYQICWCPVCVLLEQAWDEEMRILRKALENVRKGPMV